MAKVPRCPLCFVELNEHQYLYRFCPADHQRVWERFNCTPENLEEKLDCWVEHCRTHRTTLTARPFLLHVGCKSENPFWKNGHLTIDKNDVRLRDEPSKLNELISHWLVGILRDIASVPDLQRSEMWFPAALLRATHEYDKRGLASGTAVKLSGAKNVGKTIFATMALSRLNLDGLPFIGHYLYLPPDPDATVPAFDFLRALYPLQLMAQGRVAAAGNRWVPPTNPLRLNLKTLFLDSMPARIEKNGKPSTVLFWILLDRLLQALQRGLQPATSVARSYGSTYTLSLYDTAGEESERDDVATLQRLDDYMDAVAVLIDATDLACFGGSIYDKSENSIPVATEKLQQITNSRAARCVIVTKLDKVLNRLSSEETSKVRRCADASVGDQTPERELLRKWLENAPAVTENGEASTRLMRLQKEFAKHLLDLACINRVFFVWTENLDPESPGLPTAYGLTRFVRWCHGGFPNSSESMQTRELTDQASA